MNERISNVLEKIEKDDIENKYWRVPRTSGELLRSIALATKSKTILEIGCSVGYSAIWLASSGANVYTIDSCDERIELAKRNFKEAGLDKKITVLRGDALDILEKWKKKVDVVFMDANKYEHLEYYEKLIPFLNKGGIIIADNAISHKESMKTFLEKVQKDNRVIAQLIEINDGLMFVIKK